MGFPIARTLGNCLSMSNVSRITALIGPARVKDLIFTARLVEAEEASSVGLLNEIVDDLAALDTRADEIARLVAGNAPLTLSATKQAVARLQGRLSHGEGEDLILMCYTSRDFREGLDAFLTKRAPQWRGLPRRGPDRLGAESRHAPPRPGGHGRALRLALRLDAARLTRLASPDPPR